MSQDTRQATPHVTATASADAARESGYTRPTLPRTSVAFRAASALVGGLISVVLLGAVVLGLTSQADHAAPTRQPPNKPPGKGAHDAAAGAKTPTPSSRRDRGDSTIDSSPNL